MSSTRSSAVCSPRSFFFAFSQTEVTAWALSAFALPKTCSWRVIILCAAMLVTSRSVNARCSAPMQLLSTTCSSTSPSSSAIFMSSSPSMASAASQASSIMY